MAQCFQNFVKCIKACSRLPNTEDQIACAADCDLELVKCVIGELGILSATEGLQITRSMKAGLAILPVELQTLSKAGTGMAPLDKVDIDLGRKVEPAPSDLPDLKKPATGDAAIAA